MKTRDLIVWGGLGLLAWHFFMKPKAQKMPGQIGDEYGDDATEVASVEREAANVAQDARKLAVMPGADRIDEPAQDEALAEAWEEF